jgi:hypothetical protein
MNYLWKLYQKPVNEMLDVIIWTVLQSKDESDQSELDRLSENDQVTMTEGLAA